MARTQRLAIGMGDIESPMRETSLQHAVLVLLKSRDSIPGYDETSHWGDK